MARSKFGVELGQILRSAQNDNNDMKQKHIHFIGICGVGMGALAILWKKKGWKVTGSDVGFYPPISTHLNKHKIEYYPGWHPEKIGCFANTVIPMKACPRLRSGTGIRTQSRHPDSPVLSRGNDKKPDLVVVGNVAGSKNPEWIAVQENKIPYVSYPELIAQNLVKKNSIVAAGTYGKTSSAVLLSWILKECGYNPAYMFGGLSLNLEESADDPDNSEWNVLEGDEYKTSRWDIKAKFFSYKPTHLLLTDIQWDHADVYPTVESYFDVFKKLVKMIPKNGLIVANEKVSSVILNETKNPHLLSKSRSFPAMAGQDDKTRIARYGKQNGEYTYKDVQQTKNSLSFTISHDSNAYQISVPIIGEYMAENICGAFAMACEIGIAPDKIISALQKFKGIKRRLEKRGKINGADVFDDIAHSPIKAKYTLETLHNIYCHSEHIRHAQCKLREESTLQSPSRSFTSTQDDTPKIYAIFEPNTGNREVSAIPSYDHAFHAADIIIIPRLTKLKIKQGEKIIEGQELSEIIARTHNQVKYFDNDEELLEFIKQTANADDAIVFLGSHSFRGMIEELVKS